MDQDKQTGLKGDVPIVLSKWYMAFTWILEEERNRVRRGCYLLFRFWFYLVFPFGSREDSGDAIK
jgi:hypothetical protein